MCVLVILHWQKCVQKYKVYLQVSAILQFIVNTILDKQLKTHTPHPKAEIN